MSNKLGESQTVEKLAPTKGVIAFLKENGTGFIDTAEHGRVFFHASSLIGTTFDLLREEDLVLIDNIEPANVHGRPNKIANGIHKLESSPENTTDTSAEIDFIQEQANLQTHLQRLLAIRPLSEQVYPNAEIKEHREIGLEEVLKYILLSARAEKVDLKRIILEKIQYDKNHAVIGVIAKSAPNEKGDYKEFTYKIKQSDNPKVTTNIDVSDWEGDNPDYPVSGDVRAEYVNQQWTIK